jgi:hypothetical protein
MKTHHRTYDSLADLEKAASSSAGPDARRVHWRDPYWIGRSFGCWEEVRQAVRSTWPEGTALVEAMIEDLRTVEMPRPVSRQRRQRWAEDGGDELCMDRLRSGQGPWREMHKESVTAPQSITLVVDVGARCTRESDSLMWRGAAAVALSDLLEAAGYRVTLVAVRYAAANYSDGSASFVRVTLKRADQPADVAGLAAAVSGWCFRALWLTESYCQPRLAVKSGNGRSAPVAEAMPDDLADAVVIDDVWDREAALALVRRVVAGLG